MVCQDEERGGGCMSIAAIQAAFSDESITNQLDRLMLVALADFCPLNSFECWASVPTLAEKTCMSDRGVYYTLKRLTDANKITRIAGGGRNITNRYRLNLNPVRQTAFNDETLQDVQGIETINPAPHAGLTTETLHHVQLNPAPRAPKRVLEDKRREEDAVASNAPSLFAGANGSEPHAGLDTPKKEKADRKLSDRPSFADLSNYCATEGMPSGEPEKIFDHWMANGFKTGKNPIKDWKAAVRTWKRRMPDFNTNPKPKTKNRHLI
jgi:hypothetical protein